MPRPRRTHVPGGYYHVTLRGNHREAIFGEPHERRVLNEIVAENLERYAARLHAYCWMTNHLHALIQVSDSPLGPLMQRIAMRYARYRQGRMDTTGHLFDRRYHARAVTTDGYFLTALRYIHLNPVSAGLAAHASAYPWSSHRAYLGCAAPPWLTTHFGLSLFACDPDRARQRYREFMAMTPADPGWEDWDPEGESPAAPESQPPARHPESTLDASGGDRRPMGQPASSPPAPASPPPPGPELPDCPVPNRPLLLIVAEVCARHLIDLDHLRSGSKARCYCAARREIARRAIESRAATVGELAKLLDRNVSSVCRLLNRRRER